MKPLDPALRSNASSPGDGGSPGDEDWASGARQPLLLDTISLYLHIPFCHAKCHYCDFNSYAGMLGLREQYVAALLQEIAYAGVWSQREGRPRRCRTVFFGGGTPSLLTAAQVAAILEAVRRAFFLDADAEITLEANPGALEYGQFNELFATGVNRLSMGAQSFDADLLRWMGRIHTPREIETAFAAAQSAGFDNINLDFIYALPGQSTKVWHDTLTQAIELGPDHLSLYSLIVEESTPLHAWVKQGRVRPVDDDIAADMYEIAESLLYGAGYEHYELSNWSHRERACSHNLTYWHNLPYIGLGAGAHGWFASHRYSEAKPIREYINRINRMEAETEMNRAAGNTGHLPAAAIVEDECVSRVLEMSETAFVGLRLTDGIDRRSFADRFGEDFESVFGPRLEAVRAAGLLDDTDESVRLSVRGRLLGNEVFQCLLPD